MPTRNNNASLHPDDLRALSESETEAPAAGADLDALVDEMRSSSSGIAQMMLQLADGEESSYARTEGVGGRHRSCPPPGRGGGYQENCDFFESRSEVKKNADPRLIELAAMGVAEYWLQVASYLGVDAFLGMWRILDANSDNMRSDRGGNGGNSLLPVLRPYSGYLRYQKNRFVENLAAQGISPKEIQRRVQHQLCETISMVHIWRLTNKNKIKR